MIFRWNFLTQSRRIQPWFQAAGGLIYTTHKFPPNVHEQQNRRWDVIDGGTSVWNFSPQGGVGVHYFLRLEAIDRSGRECECTSLRLRWATATPA